MDKHEVDAFFKWMFGVVIVFAIIYFFPWKQMTWGGVTLRPQAMVTVTGYAESDEKNQIANFSAGVQAFNDDKDAAVNEVNAKMTDLIKMVKGYGVDEEDIKTQQVSVYQQQETYPVMTGRTKLGQWVASNTVEITLRKVEKAGGLTDILNSSGATNVYGPNFSLDTSAKASDKLLGEAVADAKTKAEKMAAVSGARLGKVITITEGYQSPVVYPMFKSAMAETSASVPAPVEVGTSKITKTVTVVWSLE